MDIKYISKNIRYLRKLHKLSQEELSKQLGINRGNIASYELGNAEPNARRLAKIAKLFNVDLIMLIETDLSDQNSNTTQRIEGLDAGDAGIKEKLENLLAQNESDLERYIKRFSEIQRIVDGFKEFHKFKMSNYKDISKDLRGMAHDYERLLDLMENILNSNKELVEEIKKRPIK